MNFRGYLLRLQVEEVLGLAVALNTPVVAEASWFAAWVARWSIWGCHLLLCSFLFKGENKLFRASMVNFGRS